MATMKSQAKVVGSEFKAIPQEIKAVDTVGRTVTGIFSVFGVKDTTNDIIHAGAFSKTIQERFPTGKIKHLWNHNFMEPPVAVVTDIKEVGRNDLPQAVLGRFPEATGGVEVTRKYLETQRGEEILKGLDSGAITEMSFGFDAVKWDYEENADGTPDPFWGMVMPVRHLREVRLYDTSDVLWGANEATVAVKSADYSLQVILKMLEQRVLTLKSIKAGNRHSAKDNELLDNIHRNLVELGSDCKKISNAAESDTEDDAGKDDSKKSQTPEKSNTELKKTEATESQAVADPVLSTLTQWGYELSLLELEALTSH